MSSAVTDAGENIIERTSAFLGSLTQVSQDFSHLEVGRDTPKEELNSLLASLPKTNDVKG
jgi:hypothetical protein